MPDALQPADDRFRVFPQFNDPALAEHARSKQRVGALVHALFTGDRLPDRFARALAERRAINLKELLESFELYERVRKRVRAKHVVDLCCGHGLTGLLFALGERSVEQVFLVDQRRPASFDGILAAAVSVAPWVAEKVRFLEMSVEDAAPSLPRGATVLGVHACGSRTDLCIDVAEQLGGAVALMPCCYRSAKREGPAALYHQLGRALAVDIHRTYRLERLGLKVDWSAIPRAVTPMNRVMIGWQPE